MATRLWRHFTLPATCLSYSKGISQGSARVYHKGTRGIVSSTLLLPLPLSLLAQKLDSPSVTSHYKTVHLESMTYSFYVCTTHTHHTLRHKGKHFSLFQLTLSHIYPKIAFSGAHSIKMQNKVQNKVQFSGTRKQIYSNNYEIILATRFNGEKKKSQGNPTVASPLPMPCSWKGCLPTILNCPPINFTTVGYSKLQSPTEVSPFSSTVMKGHFLWYSS